MGSARDCNVTYYSILRVHTRPLLYYPALCLARFTARTQCAPPTPRVEYPALDCTPSCSTLRIGRKTCVQAVRIPANFRIRDTAPDQSAPHRESDGPIGNLRTCTSVVPVATNHTHPHHEIYSGKTAVTTVGYVELACIADETRDIRSGGYKQCSPSGLSNCLTTHLDHISPRLRRSPRINIKLQYQYPHSTSRPKTPLSPSSNDDSRTYNTGRTKCVQERFRPLRASH